MANLRSKYKPAKVDLLKQKVDKENELIGVNSRSEFLEIEEGKTNKFRLFPAHEGVDFFVLRKRHWLTIEGENGDPVKRTVLNSRQHGGTKKDIIEEYVSFCQKNLSDKEKLSKVTDWKGGLGAEHSWIAYAEKISKEEREFGLISFKKTVRDAINKATFVEDDDEPIEVDPFTDPDDGLPLLIKYNSKPNKKKGEDYYEVSVGKKATPISDENLEKFDKAKTLQELYLNVYGLKDFELALEGLRFFDTENEIDFFEDEDWLEIVEKVKSQYEDSDEDEDEDEDEKPAKKSSKKPEPKKKAAKKVVEDDDEDDEDDEYEEETPKKKSSSKKKVVEDDEDEDEDEDDSDDEDEDEDSEEDDDEDDSDDEDEDEKPAKKKGKMSMDDIRARLKKGKK